MLRHLPNAITLLRAVLAAPIAMAILSGEHRLALILAIIAGGSDALDGFLAKRFQWQSALGAWLDPAADKLLMITCFAALSYVGAVPAWLLGLVLVRDLVLVGGAVAWHNLIGALVPKPSALGRATTALQIGSVLLALLVRAGAGIAAPILDVVFVVTGLATLISGIDYVRVWSGRARRQRSTDS